MALIAALVQGGGLRSTEGADHLLQLGGYAPLSSAEHQKAFGVVSKMADAISSNEDIEAKASQSVAPMVTSPVSPIHPWRRRRLLVVASTMLLALVLAGVLLWQNQPQLRRGFGFAPAIVDRPGGQLSLVQFDYLPEPRMLQLYLCVEAKHYRLKSEEIHPNPRVLLDRAYDVTDKCGYKRPVVDMHVGDVEEVSIGVSDDKQNFPTLRVYRITLTDKGIIGGFVREETAQETPRPSPTP